MRRFPGEIFRTENLSISVFKITDKNFPCKNCFLRDANEDTCDLFIDTYTSGCIGIYFVINSYK